MPVGSPESLDWDNKVKGLAWTAESILSGLRAAQAGLGELSGVNSMDLLGALKTVENDMTELLTQVGNLGIVVRPGSRVRE